VAVVAALVVLGTVGLVLGAVSVRQHDVERLAGQIQESRHDSLLRSCRAARRQNRTIVRFVVRVAPSLREAVREEFPTGRDCPAFAERRTALP
jgi:cytochrome c-type biogenesis protein CcmH/NrfF